MTSRLPQPVSQILHRFIVINNVPAVSFSLSGISPSDLIARWCHPIAYLIVPAIHLCIEPQTEYHGHAGGGGKGPSLLHSIVSTHFLYHAIHVYPPFNLLLVAKINMLAGAVEFDLSIGS